MSSFRLWQTPVEVYRLKYTDWNLPPYDADDMILQVRNACGFISRGRTDEEGNLHRIDIASCNDDGNYGKDY